MGSRQQRDIAATVRPTDDYRDGHRDARLYTRRQDGGRVRQEALRADDLRLLHGLPVGPPVLAFVIRGLKEFGEPTRKALIMDLAPEEYKARTFGAYYLIRDTVVSVAALSSALLWNISPATNFIVAAGFGVVGTALFAIRGKDVAAPAAPGSS